MVLSPVIAVNSLAAVKRLYSRSASATLAEVAAACAADYEGKEELRQWLWNAPKWCNDDDYVDDEARKILEFACREILKYRTPGGGRHLAGIHQPHPVFAGRLIPATPEGRKAGTPIPVTLSPENGTLKYGPTAALKSAAKIDSELYQWNNCVMLQYVGSTLEGESRGRDLYRSAEVLFQDRGRTAPTERSQCVRSSRGTENTGKIQGSYHPDVGSERTFCQSSPRRTGKSLYQDMKDCKQ